MIATDPGYLRFLREQAGGAEWVASVCTGAFFLAAAGLLDGYRATLAARAAQLDAWEETSRSSGFDA